MRAVGAIPQYIRPRGERDHTFERTILVRPAGRIRFVVLHFPDSVAASVLDPPIIDHRAVVPLAQRIDPQARPADELEWRARIFVITHADELCQRRARPANGALER